MSDIKPEEILDTSRNEPITENPKEGGIFKEESPESEIEDEPPQIKASKVKDLTVEEKARLISEAKNGVENPFFKVKFYKNGSSRIIKRKQPVEQTSTKIINKNSSSLTTEQLLMEHVIGLESQLATLKQKHKKLKKNYKSLYQDVYVDEEEIPPQGIFKEEGQSTSINMTPMTSALNENQDNTVNKNECSESFSQQPIFYNRNTKGWRARIAKNMI